VRARPIGSGITSLQKASKVRLKKTPKECPTDP